MSKIEVGDVIECISTAPLPRNDGVGPKLILHEKYQLIGIRICPKCETEHYDIGLKLEINFVTCYYCKTELKVETKLSEGLGEIHYCHPSRFVK